MSEESSAGSESMPEDSGESGIKGTVKWFNDAKGFGFIEHTSGKDVFVHYSVIEASGFKTLKDGEEVLYEFKEGPKGLHASRVTRENQPEESAEAPMTEQEEAETTSSPPRVKASSGLAARIVQEVVPEEVDQTSAIAGTQSDSADTIEQAKAPS